MSDEIDQLRLENKQLRRMLAVAYSGASLYTDDGELSCGREHPLIDFKRMSIEQIEQCMRQRGLNALSRVSPEEINALLGRHE